MATFYLKYRPQKVKELDLSGVRETLQKIIKSGNIPHAFLFSGPKGTGKTSAARILAKVVNCENRKKGSIEPCNKCEHCRSITKGENIDVIEMDAASHRGIDDVRTLKDAVKLVPASARNKVYIIDEAHMLTKEASNALLKTLEEPPEHVMFVMATTNPEKLIDTVRSRTTNINFRRATKDEIVRSLKKATKGEKVKAKDNALEAIAKVSGGSFRDAVKLLEQLISEGKKITAENVEEIALEKGAFNIEKFIKSLEDRNSKDALSQIEQVVVKGGSVQVVLEIVLQRLRSALLAKAGVEGENIETLGKGEVVTLIDLFSEASWNIKNAYIEQLPVEIAIIKWSMNEDEGKGSSGGGVAKEEGVKSKTKKNGDRKLGKPKDLKGAKNGNGDLGDFTENEWRKIVSKVGPKNTSTEALLRAAKPIRFNGETLTIGVYYSFHKERLETTQHRLLLETVIHEVVGIPIRVECELAEQPKKKKVKQDEVVLTQSEDEDIIRVAKEIFES